MLFVAHHRCIPCQSEEIEHAQFLIETEIPPATTLNGYYYILDMMVVSPVYQMQALATTTCPE
jgi:hypothetical protein